VSVDVHALDQADPPLLKSTSGSLGDAVPRLRAVAKGLLDAVQGTAGGWSGACHDAWAGKVQDLAERVDAAADAMDELGGTTETLARVAADGGLAAPRPAGGCGQRRGHRRAVGLAAPRPSLTADSDKATGTFGP